MTHFVSVHEAFLQREKAGIKISLILLNQTADSHEEQKARV